MPKKDFSQIALDVVRRATGEVSAPAPTPMKKAAPPVRKAATKKTALKPRRAA